MRKQLSLAICLGPLLSATASYGAVELGFSNIDQGGQVLFTGSGGFHFGSALRSGMQWQITNPGSSSAAGYLGTFTGAWQFSPVITTDPDGYQSSTVTGTGQVTIYDTAGATLVGNLTWNTIGTYGVATGDLNANADLNVQWVSYQNGATPGADPTLNALKNATSSMINVSFNWPHGASGPIPSGLGDLYNAIGMSDSFSGNITAVPEPGTLAAGAGALGMVLLGLYRSKRAAK